MRSPYRLLTGLAFSVAGFLTFYTLLTLAVLEPQIRWRPPFAGETQPVSRFWLLLFPLLSLGCCVLLYLASKQKQIPFHKGSAPPVLLAEYARWVAGENLLLSLFFFFVQLDRLNTAKEIPGFSPALPGIFIVAALLYGIVFLRRLHRHPSPEENKGGSV